MSTHATTPISCSMVLDITARGKPRGRSHLTGGRTGVREINETFGKMIVQ